MIFKNATKNVYLLYNNDICVLSFYQYCPKSFCCFDIFKEHQTDLWNDNLQDEDLF